MKGLSLCLFWCYVGLVASGASLFIFLWEPWVEKNEARWRSRQSQYEKDLAVYSARRDELLATFTERRCFLDTPLNMTGRISEITAWLEAGLITSVSDCWFGQLPVVQEKSLRILLVPSSVNWSHESPFILGCVSKEVLIDFVSQHFNYPFSCYAAEDQVNGTSTKPSWPEADTWAKYCKQEYGFCMDATRMLYTIAFVLYCLVAFLGLVGCVCGLTLPGDFNPNADKSDTDTPGTHKSDADAHVPDAYEADQHASGAYEADAYEADADEPDNVLQPKDFEHMLILPADDDLPDVELGDKCVNN